MFTSVIVELTSDGLGIDDEEVDVTGGRRLSELVPQVRTVPLRVDVAAVNLSDAGSTHAINALVTSAWKIM